MVAVAQPEQLVADSAGADAKQLGDAAFLAGDDVSRPEEAFGTQMHGSATNAWIHGCLLRAVHFLTAVRAALCPLQLGVCHLILSGIRGNVWMLLDHMVAGCGDNLPV